MKIYEVEDHKKVFVLIFDALGYTICILYSSKITIKRLIIVFWITSMGELQGLPMADDIVFELLHSEIINYAIDQSKEAVKDKKEVDLSVVEYIGFATGYKMMERLTREWPRFKDELDTMKFICTDFWTCIYKKQIDNLRTNHQGVYVLQDNAFRFLTNFSNGHQYLESAPRYVAYTCGLIRGGLANLCINSVVTAEVQSMPSCKFHIHVQRT